MRIPIKRTLTLTLVCVLVLGVVGVVPASGWMANAPIRVTQDEAPQNNPAVSGDIIVWQDGRNGTCGAWDIYMLDLSTGKESPVTTADKKQKYPKIDGDTIVYQTWENCTGDGNTDIYMYDLTTGLNSAVCTDTNAQWEPEVGGDHIVWVDERNSDSDIYMYDLKTGMESEVCTGPAYAWDPCVDGGVVVWVDDRNGNDDIYMYDIATATESAITTTTGGEWDPAIGDGVVCWASAASGRTQVWMYDLQSGVATIVPSPASSGYVNPEVDSGRIVYEDYDSDVYYYDIASGDTYMVPDSGQCEGNPDISGDLVVWNQYIPAHGNPDIFALMPEAIPTFIDELEGPDRYMTACEVSEQSYPLGADTVIIATGANWPDALGASGLAGCYDAPILLTPPTGLPAGVKAEILRLGAEDAFVIGGTDAVGAAVFTELEAMLSGTVTRLGGADRYETATIVADEVIDAADDWTGTAFVATGENFPDALAAAPLAARAQYPIYLSTGEGVDAATEAAISTAGVTHVYILGGEGVVPGDAIVLSQRTTAMQVDRIAGDNRYATAVAVAAWGVDNLGLAWNNLTLATGENYPDALAAGAAAGQKGSVMLLTPGEYLHQATELVLFMNRHRIGAVDFVGGEAAVSQAVRDAVQAVLP